MKTTPRLLFCALVVFATTQCGDSEPTKPTVDASARQERDQLQREFTDVAATFHFRDSAGALVAEHPLLGLSVATTTTGLELDSGSWKGTLSTTRIGRRGALRPASPGVARLAAPNHVVVDRGAFRESFRLGPQGVAHSLEIESRPTSGRDEALVVELTVDGLKPSVLGNDVVFRRNGQLAGRMHSIFAFDARDRFLPAHFEVHGEQLSYVVDARAAEYPIIIDPVFITETASITASNGVTNDRFGHAVAISGDTAIVGAWVADAAYIFERAGNGTWSETARFQNVGAVQFGRAVDIEGDVAIVGASIEAYVLKRASGVWSLGPTLAIPTMVTFSPNCPSGCVLNHSFDLFGTSVAVSGGLAVVGAPSDDFDIGAGNGQYGAAYVYNSTNGDLITWLRPAVPDVFGAFGDFVETDGSRVLVAASREDATIDVNDQRKGAVYLFETPWTADQRQPTTESERWAASDADIFWGFGAGGLKLEGNRALVANKRSCCGNTGSPYIFEDAGSGFVEISKLPVVGATFDLSGDFVAAGVPSADHSGRTAAGEIEVFKWSGSAWAQHVVLRNSAPLDNEYLGLNVGISGANVVTGTGSGTVGSIGYGFIFEVPDGAPQGTACSLDSDCITGHCVDGVCCDSACGGGISDCQACSTANGATVDGTCEVTPASTVCRSAAGLCDAEEICDGVSGDCPADGFQPVGFECRPSGDLCDTAELCTGTSADCPSDGLAAAGTVCRAAAGACDAEEVCDGSSAGCPADVVAAAGTECRPSQGVCDSAETCDGVAPACPSDVVAAAGTVCRGASGPCDVQETCDGTSGACPADAFAAPTVECRASTGACDTAEMCSGTSASCPADQLATAGTTCRPSSGPCDAAETCSGTAATCPADGLAMAGTVCRPAVGVCDVADTCDGASSNCPVDVLAPANTVCRAAAGACDVAEVCNGTSGMCPTDLFEPPSVECRPAAGVCDIAESCTGASAACPADVMATSGTECRPVRGACDVAEACDGATPACPADRLAPQDTECRPSAGPCDAPETCSGADSACPSDALLPAGTECRAASGSCDAAEVCSGASQECPSDADAPDGTACDGGACASAAECVSGTCTVVTTMTCDDGDECTSDRCDAVSGCVNDPIVDCTLTPDMGVAGNNSLPDAGGSDSPDGGQGSDPTIIFPVADGSEASGCGCASTPAGATGDFALPLLALIASRRRRRRRDGRDAHLH